MHPPNEKPGLYWQYTRHWCHGAHDPWYEAGGVHGGLDNPHAEGAQQHRGRWQGGAGAKLCDQMLFGAGVYKSAGAAEKEGGGKDPEREPLLSKNDESVN